MRLHKLDVYAFGPFAGHESVDFDALAGSGIFLLNGPTGAGKTSILDAICFGLYGKVPGARGARPGDIRSHLADDDQLTRVVVEFTVRGRRLKVTREPSQTRPKKSGNGTTEHAATAVLQEYVGGTWESLAGKAGEVTTLVNDLMGLNAGQFQQVILLPQGEFAQFLRADSEDRQKLLQAVFDTSRFSSIENWLKDEAARLGSGLTKIEHAVTAAFNECASVLGVEPPETDDTARRHWLADHDQRLTAQLVDAQTEAASATERVNTAAAELTAVTTIEERQTRHRVATERAEAMTDQLVQLPVLVDQLDAARRAVPVRITQEQVDELTGLLGTASDKRTKSEKALTELRPDLDAATLAELATHLDDITRVLGDLVKAADDENMALPDAQRAVTDTAAAVATTEARIADLTTQIAVLDESLEADRALVADGTEAIGLLPEATGTTTVLDQRVGQARDRQQLDGQLVTATAALKTAVDNRRTTEESRNRVFARRVASISAELAAGLELDSPCPVCGSHSHPSPAEPTDEHATQLDLTRADDALAEASGTVTGLTARIEGLTERIDALNDALGADTLDDVITAHQQATEVLRHLEARRDCGAEAQRRLNEAADLRSTLAGQLDSHRLALPGDVAAAETAAAEVARLVDSINEARAGHDTIAARITDLTAEKSCIGEVVEARRLEDELTLSLAQATATVTDKAAESGFDDVAQATAAVLDDATIATLDRQVTGIRTAQTEIDTVLRDPDVLEAVKLPPAVTSVAKANDAAAREAERVANSLVNDVKTQADALGRCRQTLDDAASEGGPLRERHNMVRSLADLARGEKGGVSSRTRMRLSNYVLSARLAQVTTAASVRLRAMTDGRFILMQTDDSGHGGRQGGLGIEVLDAFSAPRTRSTQSLSGGESFAASLALALGLADVVAAESGGVSLETLFIDEGFGTLDGDSLDAVLDILDGLRSGGRTVGVVSHVADMKERIPTHLRVERVDRISHIVQ
jgi:exonuclease SbcC